MTAGIKAGIWAVGLAALTALAGCGGDDSDSDPAGTTGAERPSRGFEQDSKRSKPRLLVMVLTFDDGRDCSSYMLAPRSTSTKCRIGTFEDHDSTPGNPLSPIAGGFGAAAFDRVGDDFKSEFKALPPSGDEDAEPTARLVGEGPPLTFNPTVNQGDDRNGPPPKGGSGTTTMTVTGGNIPKWGAVNIRSSTDPGEGGPMKVTVKRLPPTDDSIFYTVTLEGFVTYEAAPENAQK